MYDVKTRESLLKKLYVDNSKKNEDILWSYLHLMKRLFMYSRKIDLAIHSSFYM